MFEEGMFSSTRLDKELFFIVHTIDFTSTYTRSSEHWRQFRKPILRSISEWKKVVFCHVISLLNCTLAG